MAAVLFVRVKSQLDEKELEHRLNERFIPAYPCFYKYFASNLI